MVQNTRIQHIDAWRLIAVVLVILHHVTHFSNLSEMANKVPGIIWRLDSLGKFGVLIFFCISGFVICRGLIQEQASSPTVSLSAFYVRRGLRIMPPLLLYLGAIATLSATGVITVPDMAIVRSASFVCNFGWLWDCGWYLGHTWSLAFEEQFYLLFPLLFLTLGLTKNPQTLLLIIAALMAGALAAYGIGYVSLAEYCSVFIYMLTGCAFAVFWDRLRPVLSGVAFWIWLIAVVVSFALAGMIALPSYGKLVVNTVILPLLICFIVFSTPVSCPAIRKIFENRTIVYLGKASYTIYLWQQLATANYAGLAPWWTIVFLAIVFLLAHFSYKYFERPLIKIGADWSKILERGTRLKASRIKSRLRNSRRSNVSYLTRSNGSVENATDTAVFRAYDERV